MTKILKADGNADPLYLVAVVRCEGNLHFFSQLIVKRQQSLVDLQSCTDVKLLRFTAATS